VDQKESLSTETTPTKTPEELASAIFQKPPEGEAPSGPGEAKSQEPKPPEPPPETPEALKARLEKAVADAKTPEEKAAAEGALKAHNDKLVAEAPITIESIKFPEGVTITDPADKAQLDTFLGIMNDKSKTQQQRAQDLIDLQVKVQKEASERGSKAWNDLQETWQKESREAIGANLEPDLGEIAKAIDTVSAIGAKDAAAAQAEAAKVRELFDLTGFGNNVVGIRFLTKLVKAAQTSEGTPVSGKPGQLRDGDHARVLYPTMK
jgi:hypothetical protein